MENYEKNPRSGFLIKGKAVTWTHLGAASGSNRVQRGGSWYNNANNATVSNRNNNNPNNRNNNYGFRVVRSSSIIFMWAGKFP